MGVAVVTDSTAHLPHGVAERHGIRVVPLHVLVDGAEATEGHDIGPAELVEALRRHRVVTTSRPSVDEFAAAFRAELDAGAESVVSLQLSSELSGSFESALLAAERFDPARVRVVDSRSTAMGLGFCALHAARAAAEGACAADVERAARAAMASSEMFFMVRTLDYLRRGGRIGAGAAAVGTALAVKPVLRMTDGVIAPIEKVRTTQRALGRLVELAGEASGTGQVELAVHHLGAPELADQLAEGLLRRVPRAQWCTVSEVGAVIGAHTGPGVLGVAIQPRPGSGS